MKRKTFDWIVTCYDKNNKVEEAFVIKDRTEQEAEKEAQGSGVNQFDDWTMVKLDDEVKRFMKEWGSSQKEVKDVEGFSGSASAVSEMAINFGYVWVEKFRKWVNKDNSSYDQRDEEVLSYIREKYC